jgi:hypothetical protein
MQEEQEVKELQVGGAGGGGEELGAPTALCSWSAAEGDGGAAGAADIRMALSSVRRYATSFSGDDASQLAPSSPKDFPPFSAGEHAGSWGADASRASCCSSART